MRRPAAPARTTRRALAHAAALRRGAAALAVVALGVVALSVASPARAARPMITDDARLVDPKACQVESWLRVNRGRADELWAIPSCNPTGKLELALGGSLLRDGSGLSTGNSLAQAKTLFRPLVTNGFGWGLAIGVAHDPAIGTTANLIDNYYAYVPASLSLADDAVVVHLNLGALHDRQAHDTRGTWGLGTEVRLSGRTQFIAETFGESGSRPFGHAGVRVWLIPDRLQADTTLGLRLGGAAQAERWISVGLRWLSVPFLP